MLHQIIRNNNKEYVDFKLKEQLKELSSLERKKIIVDYKVYLDKQEFKDYTEEIPLSIMIKLKDKIDILKRDKKEDLEKSLIDFNVLNVEKNDDLFFNVEMCDESLYTNVYTILEYSFLESDDDIINRLQDEIEKSTRDIEIDKKIYYDETKNCFVFELKNWITNIIKVYECNFLDDDLKYKSKITKFNSKENDWKKIDYISSLLGNKLLKLNEI